MASVAGLPHPGPSVRARLRVRVSVAGAVAIGPGKIAAQEAIAQHHSLNAAANSLGMSVKSA